MKKIKIARIFDRYNGPSNYYLYDRMKRLPSEKYETICIYLERCSDAPNNQEENFTCYYLSGSKSNPLKWRKLAQILKIEAVDIIHANRHSATCQGTMGAVLAGKPVVITHVHGMNRCRNWRRKLWYRLFSWKIIKAIAISDGVAQDISENFPGLQGKAEVVLNSIDYDKFHNPSPSSGDIREELGISKDAYVFVCAGRLVPTKGHDLLLHSFSIVKKSFPNACLLLAGDGRLEKDLKALARELGIDNDVIFAGYRSDIPQLLKASNAFVLSSVKEGFGLCLAEAMAAGIPVVATGEGGVSEVLDSAGLYIAERTPENLSDGMIKVLNLTTDEQKKWVDKADEKVLNLYNHENAVERLNAIYQQCIS